MYAKNKLARREDIPTAERWHLNDIYATRDAWLAARDSIAGLLETISTYHGQLAEPQALLDCLTKVDEMEISLSAVFAYARLQADTDTTNQDYQADTASCLPLLDQASAATAFINPELLALPEEALAHMADKLPGLVKTCPGANRRERTATFIL